MQSSSNAPFPSDLSANQVPNISPSNFFQWPDNNTLPSFLDDLWNSDPKDEYTQDSGLNPNTFSPLRGLASNNRSYNPLEPLGVFPQATLTESSVFRYAQDRFLPVPPPLDQPFDNHAYDSFEPPGAFHQAPLTLPVLPVNESRLGGESSAPSTAVVTNSTPKRLNEDERRALLEQDAYILSFDAKTVICSGCRKKIKLDGRDHARFYTTNWYNHKSRCLGVEAGMTAEKYRERDVRNEAGWTECLHEHLIPKFVL